MAEATTGYYRSGESWLHRRSPITKLLALGLVLLASFALPPLALAPLLVVVVLAGWSAGLLRPMLASLRIPIVLFASIVLVNAFFFPGARDVIVQLGPAALSSEGLAFGSSRPAVSWSSSWPPSCSCSRPWPTTSLRPWSPGASATDWPSWFSRSSRWCRACRLERAPSWKPSRRAACPSRARSSRGCERWCRSSGRSSWARSSTSASARFALEARGFGTRPDRTSYRRVPDPPADRWLRVAILLGAVAVVASVVLGLGR